MPLKPGQGPNPAADSMAAAMVEAFKQEWPKFMEGPLPDDEKFAALRHLFVAVSQGVVQHLRDHPEAFNVTVTSTEHVHTGGAHVHGNGSHAHSGGSHNHPAEIASITTTGTTA